MDIDNFLNQHENKSLLRLLTCGSVDDGKSTLIGRLLYDSKLIFDDQLSALHADSEKVGNAGEGEIDYALLLDGLKAEREQGITIDVAYRYFATPKRKFIIADTPGHEQYTRNMATGASTADLALILIDARYGVITQTKRHTFLVSLLGLKHIVVVVNKMDLKDYDEAVFHSIKADFEEFSADLNLPNVSFIPISALKGDNVVEKSDKTAWYKGEPLLPILEEVDVAAGLNLDDFRFPVQLVSRPNLDFRGFAGTVASGTVRPGDKIKALPSLKESTIKRIVTADGDLEEAFASQAVTLELNDEIDISNGEMIVHAENVPHISSHLEASIVWMTETPLKEGKTYVIRHTSRTTKASISELKFSVDVNTLEKNPTTELKLNEIGRIVLATHLPLFFDPYAKNRETGSFILIDPISNTTAGAGMIEGRLTVDKPGADVGGESATVGSVDRREFLWEKSQIDAGVRANRNGHKGKAVLFIGNAAKKNDLAKFLELKLFNNRNQSFYLGVNSLMEGLDADLENNFQNREEHIRRIGELGRILTDAGLIFISALDRIDAYELSLLKHLNSPNELLVISVGQSPVDDHFIDLKLGEEIDRNDAIAQITTELNRQNVFPEYTI
ncbi:Bifunctional enzyme CysN/CysC [Pontiella desulfatans]|uniref:Sulfate adenylyltransferase subunit 1 n=1 Tax=Pontiella desulfatans TaxID=2750659 RepID=A0A6C2TX47_PONDE|nr:sulfate adenylyltransferase subunit CysN [Pontiella desulfatans]VGO12122.1 Bifunctional enzyme CysN/CysC [Pontiella desulfatans]